ncbi:choice-of-anchor Q domain-containing protein [Flavobacterium sp.]
MKKVLLFALLLAANHTFATRYFVNASAAGTNNGLTWTNAYTSLQAAISVAIAGDEIWVATGIYKPSTSSRSSSFVMKNGVSLYGGFAGTETNISERNIAANPTTLSGDIGQLGDNTDNTRIIVKIQNITSSIVFDGFRIVSGYDSASSAEGAGFNIANNLGGNITINNCVIYDNYAYRTGGGALIDASIVTFNDTQFLYNSSFDYGGGAIYSGNVSSSTITLNRCRFTGNSSRSGAVIVFDGNSLVFDRCIITNNTTTSHDMISTGTNSNFKISNTLIAGNLLTSNTSSIIESGAASGTLRDIVNCTIVHNRSSVTSVNPAIRSLNLPIRVYNSIVYENSGAGQITSGCVVQNCILSGTYATAVDSYFTNPNFIAPATLASAPFDATVGYNYALMLGSPGINTGNNTRINGLNFDVAGNNRIFGTTVDIGAYERDTNLATEDLRPSNEAFFYNSFDGELVVTDSQYHDEDVMAFDISGKLVKQTKIKSTRTQLHLAKGIYILKIKDISKKIAVQ